MFHNTSKAILFLGLFFVGSVLSRSLKSPNYLFSSESNIIEPERKFIASQFSDTVVDGSTTDDQYEHLERVRRSSDSGSATPAPKVTPSKDLCGNSEFVIRWTSPTSEAERLSSKGAIVVLCRKGTDSSGNLISPTVFVSNDHGLQWKNVTEKFQPETGKTVSLSDYYNVDTKPNFIIFSDKINRKLYYSYDGLETVQSTSVPFNPNDVSINPRNTDYVISTDDKRMYLSKDAGKTFKLVLHLVEVNAYYWGDEAYFDKNTDLYVDGKVGKDPKTHGYKLDCGTPNVCGIPVALTKDAPLNGDITDFLVKNEYMFVTKDNPTNKGTIDLYVKYTRSGQFKKATIQTTSPLRELFVYDIRGSVVMLVANHRKNETNLYTSLDKHGIDYSLSLPRVLYHNPNSEVSSHWLRRAVAYRFVDIRRIQGLPWVYFATQLTVGPVGGRYLISMVTYNSGGAWQPIRGPPVNKFKQPCLYPSCSLHVNLFYGSIYRYSPTTPLMSRASAPGLIMTTGVLGANLKITPDTYISRDGGVSFNLILRGKRRFAFGDHGSIVIASDYLASRYFQYSYDFKNMKQAVLSDKTVNIKRILTEPGEKGAVFLVLGTVAGKWRVFQVNATRTLGRPCTSDDYIAVNLTDVSVSGCKLRQVKQRNASRVCLAGPKAFQVVKTSYHNCVCRRLDYRCGTNFRPDTTGGCEMVDGANLIPSNCPEGTFYNRSRGYTLIKSHNCVEDNVTKAEYSPVKTPCPVQALSNLTMTTNLPYSLHMRLGETLTINATLANGYLPNIQFRWVVGVQTVYRGRGKKFSVFSKKMTKLGTTMVILMVSNSRSGIRRIIPVVVIHGLDKSQFVINTNQSLPTVNEPIMFFIGLKASNIGTLSYHWKFETTGQGQGTTSSSLVQKVTTIPSIVKTFTMPGNVQIQVTIHNQVSKAIVQLSLTVRPDLKVKNVRLSPSKDNNILVTWDKVNAPGYRIKTYSVNYRKASDHSFQKASCPQSLSTPTCTITNTDPYTTYYVKVVSVTDKGDVAGPESDVALIKTPMTKPGKVGQLNVFMEGVTKIVASWTPPTSPNGMIIGYKYKLYKSGDNATDAKNISDGTNTVAFNKLAPNTKYFFEVAAVNQKGQVGEYKKNGPIMTGFDVPTLPPTNLTLAKVTSNSAVVIWTPPKIENFNDFFSPKGYKVYMILNDQLKLHDTVSINAYNFTNLVGFTTYRIKVSAFVTKKEGPLSDLFMFTTQRSVPIPPTDVQASDISSTAVSISWKYNGDASSIEQYAVYQLFPRGYRIPVFVKTSPARINDLIPYTKYTFAVKSFGYSDTSSSFSKNVTFTTLEDRPGVVGVLNLKNLWPLSSSIRVSWAPPFTKNGVITAYHVKWYSDPNQIKEQVINAGKKTFLDIHHLRQETKYTFDVYAYTKIGVGPVNSDVLTTSYYPYGSEHLIVSFVDDNAVRKLAKEDGAVDKFIEAVYKTGKIRKERIADVIFNSKDNTAEFELISKEQLLAEQKRSEIPIEMDKVKTKLASGFVVMGYKTKSNGVKSSFQYSGRAKEEENSNSGVIIGLSVGGVIVILILLAAMFLLYRKYRQHSSYNKFDNQFQYNHEDGTVRAVNDGSSVEIRPSSASYRHNKKDIETVPLADADELT